MQKEQANVQTEFTEKSRFWEQQNKKTNMCLNTTLFSKTMTPPKEVKTLWWTIQQTTRKL